MGRAKGSNMHHMRTFVVRRFGTSAWDDTLRQFSPAEAAELRALVPMTWHDLDLQHRLLQTVDRHLGSNDGSLADAIGRYEADQDLRLVHRIFLKMANPAFVLEQAGEYWRRFYDTGVWEIRRSSPQRATGVLAGVDPFDPLFARYLHAYIGRLFELVGAKELRTSYRVETRADQTSLIIEGSWR